MCGLASSKYKNARERNAILQHLSETELPIDPGEVQRLIRGLGLAPSGSSSLQQFAFFLLSFMSESLPFPPWKPKPVMEIVMPTPELLAKAADTTIKRELGDDDDCPYAYLKAGDDGARLWQFRRFVVLHSTHARSQRTRHTQHTCHTSLHIGSAEIPGDPAEIPYRSRGPVPHRDELGLGVQPQVATARSEGGTRRRSVQGRHARSPDLVCRVVE